MSLAKSVLDANREDTERANDHATRATSLAKQSMQISELIEDFDRRDYSREDSLLWYQSQLTEIYQPVGALEFDLPNRDIVLGMQGKYAELLLRETVAGIVTQDQQQELAMRDKVEADRRARFAQVQSMFLPEEATVYRQRENVLISAHGFQFPTGRSEFESENFAVANKVIEAIAIFPGSRIGVTGHTDSTGGAETNRKLSQERAANVMKFLNEIGQIPMERLSSEGFGEDRPFANNKTAEGRAQNRRVDILIKNDLPGRDQESLHPKAHVTPVAWVFGMLGRRKGYTLNVSRHRLLSFGLNDYASKVDSRFGNGCGYLLVMAITAVFLTAADQTRAEQSSQESTGEEPVGSESANEVARELANPNTPLASLTLKNQITFFEGDLPGADDEMSGTLLFQPALPFPLSNGDKIIFRPAIPLLVEQSIFDPAGGGDFDSKTGLGDIAFDLAYAKSLPSGLLMAGGLISALPTATRGDLGREQWTLGPEILFGFISEKYLLAIFPSHQWDIAGSGNEDMDVSLTTIQAFAVGLPGGGWNVGSQPIILYDHESEEWTVPLNLQVGRTLVVGDRPWKFAFEVNYYVERPGSFGPEWMIGFNITPVVANRLADFASGLFGK